MTVIATAGHVDHGKTSLVGALTGVNTDRLAEEQRRGLTIDLGFAHAALPSGREVSFIDVPGHVRFLRNMLAGVGGIDACLLVVDSREGWKPQTEEHFEILRLLGVPCGVIAFTKCDLVTATELADLEVLVRHRVEGTFLDSAPVVATSIHDQSTIATLQNRLDNITARNRPESVRPRLWIDRVFSPAGIGTVVTGTLLDAPLHRGTDIEILPSHLRGRIRAMQSRGTDIDTATPGSRLAINISGIAHHDIERGHQLVLPDQWWLSHTVDVELHVLPRLTHELTRRGNFLVYIGSDEVEATVRLIGDNSIQPGNSGKARLFFHHPLAVAPNDHFIVRETGRDETVAGGIVLDVDPVKRLTKADPTSDVDHFIDERGVIGAKDLFLRTGQDIVPTVDDVIFSSAMLSSARQEILDMLTHSALKGLELATLPDHLQQAARTLSPSLASTESGRIYTPECAPSRQVRNPIVDAFATARFTPPDPATYDRSELRRLVQSGHLLNLDGVFFATSTIDDAHAVAKQLLTSQPEGFTASAFREALGTSRKYAIPLAEALDARGITRRRGDVRIAGPRL